MRTATLRPQVWKEARALAPAWLACTAAMTFGAMLGVRRSGDLGILAYFVGGSALGALSIGHEYSLRTLGILLVQPAKRQRLLLVKLGLLAVMLLALYAVASATLGAHGQARVKEMPLALPLLWCFFVAPWLTMVAGSAIGGAVFTMAAPWMLMLAGEWLGIQRYGYTSQVDVFRLAFVWWGTFVACATGPVLCWRTFTRLEAVDGRGVDVRLPGWFAVRAEAHSGVTRRHPYWLLIKKELRLQQLTLAVAAIAAIAGAVMALTVGQSSTVAEVFAPLAALYVGLIAMVMGSIASAEERRLGTLDWQLLLPVAAWKQWTIKAAVVIGLVVLMVVGVPAVMAYLSPYAAAKLQFTWPTSLRVVSLLIAFTIASLYVSSLCSTGMWALVVSLPVIVTTFGLILQPLEWSAFWAIRHLELRFGRHVYGWPSGPGFWALAAWWLPIAGVSLVMLRLGLDNHRSADRTLRRIVVQSVVLLACVTAATLLWAIAIATLP